MKPTIKLTRQGVRDLGGNDQRKKKPMELPPDPMMESEFVDAEDDYPRRNRGRKGR